VGRRRVFVLFTDRYIGWAQQARRKYIHLLAYNTQFLILPWVTAAHLASHILGRTARRISAHGQLLARRTENWINDHSHRFTDR
jgi:hypothetical protein